MPEKELKLKVIEALQDDVNKSIVRVDSSFMQEIGVRPGDVVKVIGERETVAIVDRAYPGDIGLKIARIDGITRRNAKTGIGEVVTVLKADIKEAKKVIIAPASKGVRINAPPQIFKQGLLGKPVVKGDIVSLGSIKRRERGSINEIYDALSESMMGFGLGSLKFVVADSNPKQAVIISELTDVVFNPEAIEIKEEKVLDITYDDIGGLKEEIDKVREMVELPLKHPEIFERLGIDPPKGVLLHGPPGTGKTLLAKAVANETNSHFILINGPEIMSKFYGESEGNLRKKFEEAEKNSPSIVFIDEIDAIAPKREEVHGEVERRVVAQLLALMDGLNARGKVVVIAATNIPNSIDIALRRPGRFDREIEIGVPGKQGRLDVLKIHTRNMPLTKNVNLKEIADKTYGFVGADLAALTKEAAMIVLRKIFPDLNLKEKNIIPKEILEKLKITKKDFARALTIVRPSALREVLVEIPDVKWDEIGGLEDVKQELKEAVEWPLKNPESFKNLGVKPPKGILIYGAPGTGKTLLAKAVAKESESNFIQVNGPELQKEGIVGRETERLRKMFKRARQVSPCILFFDEIDSFARKRSAGAGSYAGSNEGLLNSLLTEMDGLENLQDVVVIAATNRPDMLDNALLRPGRFDRIILCPAPDKKTREEIFKVHTKGMPLEDVKIDELAEKTEGYAGADIESICREAAIFALRKNIKADKIGMDCFEKALKKVRPSITKEIEKAYEDIINHFSSARAKEMKDEKPSYMG